MSTMGRFAKILKEPFPFYFNNDFENALLILGTGAFTIGFLAIFKPFGHEDILTLGFTAQIGLVVVIGLAISIFLLPRIVPSLFDNWNIQKYVVFNIWNILFVGTLCGLHAYEFCPPGFAKSLGQHVFSEILHTFFIGLVPLFMMTFMIRNRILLEYLQKARAANSRIDQFRAQNALDQEQYGETQRSILKAASHFERKLKVNAGGNIELTESETVEEANGETGSEAKTADQIGEDPRQIEEHRQINATHKPQRPIKRVMPRRATNPSRLAIQSDTNESLELAPDSFLYAEAQDNYVKIIWQENGELQSHLLRLSMKKLEFALGSRTIVRCHRSYLVNLTKVDSVRGNANGYRLHMGEAQIPVSRSKGKFVLKSIDHMSLLSRA